MEKITAPYGFVPVSSKVVHPAWVQPRKQGDAPCAPPLQDVPFRDGICGGLELTLTAETPIFVRGAGANNESRFFTLPGGRQAIPGTSLRGYLRNLVEIATFGRLYGRVNDHRYAVRDLQNPELYREFMSVIAPGVVSGKSELTPLVNAGWLQAVPPREDGELTYKIEVADFAKIEYSVIKEIAAARKVMGFDPGRKQSAADKYDAWGSASLDVSVEIELIRHELVRGVQMPSQYGRVKPITGTRQGTLVFTGQPSEWRPGPRPKGRRAGNAKHHDFVFCPATRSKTYPVEPKVFADFEFAHSDRGQQNNLGRSETPNPEWARWRGKLEAGGRVPVFFLLDDKDPGRVKALGLAMMFRLPYRQSIGDAVRKAQPEANTDTVQFDFADGLFGTVTQEKQSRPAIALKGRVSVSHAVVVGQPRTEPEIKVVLGQPRASYYPNYVEQDPARPGAPAENGKRYTTWQDDDARPRGWKVYRKATTTWSPPRPTGSGGRPLDQSNMETRFQPLARNTQFRTRIDLHNVRPVELGALLWVLDLGGDPVARHSIGMARPLGFGRARFDFKPAQDLRDVQGNPVDLAKCRAAFVAYMEEQLPGWGSSFEIQEFLALHRPVEPALLQYQRLDPGGGRNEFSDAKKPGLALPSVLGAMGQSPPRAAMEDRKERRKQGDAGGPALTGRADHQSQKAQTAAQTLIPARAGWEVRKPGSTLEVTLTELNKKGKWRATAENGRARGTIEGTPPADAAPGKRYTVKVIQGSDPTSMNLKWPD